jgi:hypothetical protein
MRNNANIPSMKDGDKSLFLRVASIIPCRINYLFKKKNILIEKKFEFTKAGKFINVI